MLRMHLTYPSWHHVSHLHFPSPQELHRDLLFGRGIRVLRGLPVPPAVSFECVTSADSQWFGPFS